MELVWSSPFLFLRLKVYSFTIWWNAGRSKLPISNSPILSGGEKKKKKIVHSCCEEITVEDVWILLILFSFDNVVGSEGTELLFNTTFPYLSNWTDAAQN